jgi:hypothetical protein
MFDLTEHISAWVKDRAQAAIENLTAEIDKAAETIDIHNPASRDADLDKLTLL